MQDEQLKAKSYQLTPNIERSLSLKQKTCRLNNKEDFFAWVEKIKASEDFKTAKEVLIKVLTAQFTTFHSKYLFRALKENFPNAKIIGTSMTNFGHKRDYAEATQGWVTNVADLSENYAVLSCFYFYDESSKVTVFEIDANELNSVGESLDYFTEQFSKIKNLVSKSLISNF